MKKVRKLLGLLLVLAWSTCLYAQKPETHLLQVKEKSSFSKTTEVTQTKAEQRMLSRNGLSAIPIKQTLKQLDYNSELSYIKTQGVDIKAETSDYIPTFYGGAVGQALVKLKLEKDAEGTDTVGFTIADCPFAGSQPSLGGYVYPLWGTWVKSKYVGYWALKQGNSTFLYGYIAWDPSSNNSNGEIIGGNKMVSSAGADGYEYWNQSDGAAYSKTKDSIYLLAVKSDAILLGITSGKDSVVNELGSITGLPEGEGEGVVSLACNNAGVLYTITFSGDLYSIDPTTLAATKIGETGYTSGSFTQSMAVDPKTDKLYWAGVVIQGTRAVTGFFEVNTTTGAATIVKGGIPQTSGLASNYSNPDILAPTEFTATLSENNPLIVNLKITLPTKDLNGDLILDANAPVAVIVYERAPGQQWTQKEEISSNVAAGATIEKAYTNIAEGEYGYAVAIKSKTGTTGNRLEQYVYCMKVDLPYTNGFEDSETDAQKNLITEGAASLDKVAGNAHTGTNSYYLDKNGYIEIKGIPVEKGGVYKVSLWSKDASNGTWLYIGNNDAEDYYEYQAAGVYEEFTYNFIAKNDGQESIKIFVDYKTDMAYIDDVTIEQIASASIPNVPTDISVKAAENGVKKALLSFTNPSITMGEKELSQLSGIIVYYGTNRTFPFGEDTIHILTTEVGKEMVDVEIEVPTDGKYYFGLVSFNELGECAYYTAPNPNGVYIGTDIPSTTKTLNAEIKEGKLKLIWNKVTTGINGGYIPEGGVQYLLTYKHGIKIDSVELISDTTYTFETLPLDHYLFEVKAVVDGMYSLGQKTYKTVGMAENQIFLAEATKSGSLSTTFPLQMSASLSTAQNSAITQSIYQPTGSAMYITKLNLLTAPPTDDITQRYVVYMGYKDSNAFAGTKDWVQPENLFKVFDGEIVSNSATAITQIPISGFYYDGEQALLVSIVKPSREDAAAAWNTYLSPTVEGNKWGSLYKSSSGLSFDTVKDLSEQTSLLTANTGVVVPALLVDKMVEPSKVKGTVLNELGEAIEATIKITSLKESAATLEVSVKASADGKYEFAYLPDGDFELSFSCAGYIDTVAPLKIQGEGSVITINMAMKSATLVTISGKLVDGGGNALSGLDIKAISTKEVVETTNTEGVFEFEVYGSTTYKFLAEKEGMKTFEHSAKIGDKDTTFANFVMEYIPMDMVSVTAVENASKAAVITWTKPGKSEIKTWNASTDTLGSRLTAGGGAISLAHRYLPSDLTAIAGKKIIKAGFVPSDPTAEYTIRICADTNTELYKKELRSWELTMNKWNDIDVSLDIDVPADKELWIIIDIAAGYENHPIAFGQSEAVANKGDLLGLAGKWMRASSASTIKTNLLIRFTVQTSEASDAPNGYIVYRGKSDAEFSAYTKVSEANVSANTYTDASYASADPGLYKYAVCADYYQETPKPVYSNILVKDMEFAVNVEVKTNGASADGASVSLVNKEDKTLVYTAKVDKTGKVLLANVWRGVYAAEITLPYHETITEEWNVNTTLNKVITLKELIANPSIISVTVEGDKAIMKYSANSLDNWFDNVESYTDFAIDNIGEWTMANKMKKGGIEKTTWPNMDKEQAFIVFNSSKTTPALAAAWSAYSGSKYFISFFSDVANKDLMIRSIAKGGGVLSFYQFGIGYDSPETYKVLYSATDEKVASFKVLPGTSDIKASDKWERVQYNIPADAKYIAIQYTSEDQFAFGVDDISYAASAEVKPASFEFYVDGKKVGDAKANATQYVFENLSVGEHVLGVKSIFVSGMSELVTKTIEISSTPKPTDLKVVVEPKEAKATFTFKAPSGFTPKSYKVYLGEEMKAENLTETSYVFTNMTNGKYVASVVAVYTEGESEKATVSFEVKGVASEDMDLSISAILYPNPSHNGIYTLYISEKANIEVVDFSGRLVYKLNNVQEGKTTLDLSSKGKGIYYVRVKTNNGTQTIKAILN